MTPSVPSSAVVLIFRTVSVEKLDAVLAACKGRWPEASLVVLSTAARRAELLADPRVTAVEIAEPGPDGYARNLRLRQRYTAVVLPVGNRSGTGYANVMLAAARAPAGSHFVARYASVLHAVSPWRLRYRAWFEMTLIALAFPPAWLFSRRRF